jgi:aspartyl aminopeptidase
MPEERTLPLIVRVITVVGQNIDHRYTVPSDDKEAEKSIDSLANMIMRAMAPKASAIVSFDNPLIVYNPDNILGIRTDLVGSEQDNHIFETKLKKKLGLY